MLSENIRTVRKEKGISQEELAVQLNVVRQTVSKWEKGLSVPNAQLLIKLAEILEVPVSVFLGDEIEPSEEKNVLAEHLERLNVQLARRNLQSKRIWKTIKIICITILVATIVLMVLSAAS